MQFYNKGLTMKKFILCLMSFKLCAYSPLPSNGDLQEPKLHINNKILVTVMNKPISVLDVVKKMNVMLEQSYPEYKNIPAAKHQFYSQQWKYVLMQMIDSELMLKNAEKLELKITDAEIREEIHTRFGPNIMKSLTNIGITYDEAKKMVETDLISQRMMWYRVHSKALSKVVPQEIKKSYQDYISKNPGSNIWKYEVLSVRANAQETGSILAGKAFDMLNAAKLGIKEAALAIKTESSKDQNTQITVSDVISAKEYELSNAHKDVLKTLKVGQYSDPVEQTGKNQKEKVYRIFHLIDLEKKEPEKFTALAEQFKDKLINEKVNEFNGSYIKKLRDRYGFTDLSSLDKLEPFSLEP